MPLVGACGLVWFYDGTARRPSYVSAGCRQAPQTKPVTVEVESEVKICS
jgi:hypothetical protein